MTTLTPSRDLWSAEVELHNGDRMTREEFHRAYEETPENFRAELIGGIVYVSSPVGRAHAKGHFPLTGVFFAYESSTPGVEGGDNATLMLGDEGEPQPDLFLRILPEYGGQSRTRAGKTTEFIEGPPELVAEIAHSSLAIDLHAKLEDYRRYGVLEYLVVCLKEREIRWFDFRSGEEPSLDANGTLRIRTFPGLWINVDALLARDHARLMASLNAGLATPEHAEFAKRLAAQRRQ